MTQVGGLDVLFAWIEFVTLAGGMLAVLLRRSGRPGPDSTEDRPDDDG
jgi:hypothetical protein